MKASVKGCKMVPTKSEHLTTLPTALKSENKQGPPTESSAESYHTGTYVLGGRRSPKRSKFNMPTQAPVVES